MKSEYFFLGVAYKGSESSLVLRLVTVYPCYHKQTRGSAYALNDLRVSS